MWRTPNNRAKGGGEYQDPDKVLKRWEAGHQVNLSEQVRLWPTPTGRDWKDGSAQSCMNVPANGLLGRVVHQWPNGAGRAERSKRYGTDFGETGNEIGGSLNPTWVEWLMGFPLGWTDCVPSATRSSRKSRKS